MDGNTGCDPASSRQGATGQHHDHQHHTPPSPPRPRRKVTGPTPREITEYAIGFSRPIGREVLRHRNHTSGFQHPPRLHLQQVRCTVANVACQDQQQQVPRLCRGVGHHAKRVERGTAPRSGRAGQPLFSGLSPCKGLGF